MTVTYRQGLSILEIIAYSPALVISLLVAWRHGFSRRAGWYFFIILSLLRLVGNGCFLGTITYPNNVNLYIAYGVCNAIGLTPLTLGIVSALSRANDSIQRNTGTGYWPKIFSLIALPSIAGMILSIVGMSIASSLESGLTSTLTRVGMGIYIATWFVVLALAFMIWVRYADVEKGEHRLVWVGTICMPVLAVRLVYSALAIYTHIPRFNMFTGSPTVFLFMDILEEIFIVYAMVGAGLTLQIRQPVSKEGSEQIPLQDEENKGDVTGGDSGQQPQFKQYRYWGGPIIRLVIYIMNKTNERRAARAAERAA